MDTSAWIASSAIVVSSITAIYGAINHRRVISVCCSRKCITSIDIENTTPQGRTLEAPPPPKIYPPPFVIEI